MDNNFLENIYYKDEEQRIIEMKKQQEWEEYELQEWYNELYKMWEQENNIQDKENEEWFEIIKLEQTQYPEELFEDIQPITEENFFYQIEQEHLKENTIKQNNGNNRCVY
jgi:hypothetical protein